MNSPSTSIRIASAFAAIVITVLVTASQFGLADHYGSDAASQLAALQAARVAQGASAAAAGEPRI
jgi:hypothetical protein